MQVGQTVITGAEQTGQKLGGWEQPDRSWWQSAFVQSALSAAIFNLSVERLAKVTWSISSASMLCLNTKLNSLFLRRTRHLLRRA